ncbi:MAG: inorganic diphosphatase, partial [Chlorobaculum sp.]|nr:inorganic diphosphatase [Chlorobaculum sp.]
TVLVEDFMDAATAKQILLDSINRYNETYA